MHSLAAFTPLQNASVRTASKSKVAFHQNEICVTTRAAGFEGCQDSLLEKIKIVGCGSCGVDYLASIASYPKPDQKLRTDALEVQGGGNCANALTAAARLGLSPTIVTKIGGDGLGDGIISELAADGVDTSLILRAAGHPSPFTYIIVDREGGTRTCIHTPGAPMTPEEMTQELIQEALEGAKLVYFDGRLTEAALLLARAARTAGIAVLVEGERLRPGLEQLLHEADYVVTSAHFPQEWSGEPQIGDAILEVARRLPNAQMIFTTRGTKGSVCLVKQAAESSPTSDHCLQDIIDNLSQQLSQSHSSSSSSSNGSSGSSGSSSSPVCISSNNIEIQPARVLSSQPGLKLRFSAVRDAQAAAAAASEAAARAAAANADPGRADAYTMTATKEAESALDARWQVYVATSAQLPAEAVADTTGAGDSFIGSVMYGIATGMTPDKIMALGAVVAACKCTALGARPGLPRRDQLASSLL